MKKGIVKRIGILLAVCLTIFVLSKNIHATNKDSNNLIFLKALAQGVDHACADGDPNCTSSPQPGESPCELCDCPPEVLSDDAEYRVLGARIIKNKTLLRKIDADLKEIKANKNNKGKYVKSVVKDKDGEYSFVVEVIDPKSQSKRNIKLRTKRCGAGCNNDAECGECLFCDTTQPVPGVFSGTCALKTGNECSPAGGMGATCSGDKFCKDCMCKGCEVPCGGPGGRCEKCSDDGKSCKLIGTCDGDGTCPGTKKCDDKCNCVDCITVADCPNSDCYVCKNGSCKKSYSPCVAITAPKDPNKGWCKYPGSDCCKSDSTKGSCTSGNNMVGQKTCGCQ